MNEEKKIEENIKEKKGVRDTLYGRIDISLETMDKILVMLFGLLLFALIVGILI
ncbi:hypothetical protein [uncultured Clostridium sp.]|uniref:hypothetical protein n=1 Tax=uncultured Clostridium sp. TaxID=59620 RepID=UPI00260D5994|nr:hypothetical protein [uncultured Clostridium sp.]